MKSVIKYIGIFLLLFWCPICIGISSCAQQRTPNLDDVKSKYPTANVYQLVTGGGSGEDDAYKFLVIDSSTVRIVRVSCCSSAGTIQTTMEVPKH